MYSFWTNGLFDEVENVFKELQKSNLSSYQENFPPMDMVLEETTGDLELTFALAGFNKDEITISVEDDFLKIVGKKNKESETSSKKVIRRGIRARDFECKYQLPARFNLSDSYAKFDDGLLLLVVPVKKEAKPKQLKIS